MNNREAAKELFLKFAGSKFHMQREGEYDLYCSFNVSKEQERVWAAELQQNLLEQIPVESDALRIRNLVDELRTTLSEYQSPAIISRFFDAIWSKEPLLDSFSKLLISEAILDLVEHSVPAIHGNIISHGKKIASDLVQSVMANAITVAPGYSELGYLVGFLTEDKIRQRAARDLERCGR